jgi:hypothetical protein
LILDDATIRYQIRLSHITNMYLLSRFVALLTTETAMVNSRVRSVAAQWDVSEDNIGRTSNDENEAKTEGPDRLHCR